MHFITEVYASSFRYDRNCNSGAILLFIREDTLTKIINKSLLKDFEGFFVELNLHKKKIFLCCSYNPHKSNNANHPDILWKTLGIQMSKYDIFSIVGNFNKETTETAMSNFCDLHSFIKDPTCYKNQNKPTCINLKIIHFRICLWKYKT